MKKEKRLKTLAMYLPQFHRIPENDKWWGEGYTDWVAVKEAKPLFEGHNQPRVPLNNNYYDLSDISVMHWQAKIAKAHGVDGFCIYHYWFGNGKKLLEKPAERLLADKTIDIEFCFCWANETWARSWSKMYHTNPWAEKYEENAESGSIVLVKQEYGDKEEWKKHFDYLLPFFKDKRYIKKDNKPVFAIYLPDDITMFTEMSDYFDKRCKVEGFSGIYIIGANATESKPGMDGAMYVHARTEFIDSSAYPRIINGVRVRNYEDVWKAMLSMPCVEGAQTFFGGFVDRDDTPRRGGCGRMKIGTSVEAFENNLYKLAIKNIHYNSDYMFIDAWNEWGEGCYLEPDTKNGYGYLDAMNRVMRRVNDDEFDAESEWKKLNFSEKNSVADSNLQKDLNKYRTYFRILDRWFVINEKGKTIADFFVRNGFETVLIYGYTSLADHMIYALKDSGVQVLGYIDRRDGLKNTQIPIYNLERGFPIADVIVVTPTYDFEMIRKVLAEKIDSTIVSIEEVIDSVY